MKIIVTAGGQGTKMWPYSRQDKPKQFQPIIGNKSTYQQTIETLLKAYNPDDIYVSTKHKFIRFVAEQSPQIHLRNYVVEPDIALDRGPAEGIAIARLAQEHPDEPFIIVQADCVRDPEDKFLDMLANAERHVTKTKKMLTGGVKAVEPNMGVDYLLVGDVVDESTETYRIDEFIFRKETLKETRALIENFHVVTHSNHMCWYPELMLDAYKKYRPDWYKALKQIQKAFGSPSEYELINAIYGTMEKGPTESVTTHVMNSGEALISILPYKWTDIGTWGAIYDYYSQGGETVRDGNIIAVDTEGSLIKVSNPDKLVAVIGLDNCVVVDTPDALLIVPKDQIDKLKDVQTSLSNGKNVKYL